VAQCTSTLREGLRALSGGGRPDAGSTTKVTTRQERRQQVLPDAAPPPPLGGTDSSTTRTADESVFEVFVRDEETGEPQRSSRFQRRMVHELAEGLGLDHEFFTPEEEETMTVDETGVTVKVTGENPATRQVRVTRYMALEHLHAPWKRPEPLMAAEVGGAEGGCGVTVAGWRRVLVVAEGGVPCFPLPPSPTATADSAMAVVTDQAAPPPSPRGGGSGEDETTALLPPPPSPSSAPLVMGEASQQQQQQQQPCHVYERGSCVRVLEQVPMAAAAKGGGGGGKQNTRPAVLSIRTRAGWSHWFDSDGKPAFEDLPPPPLLQPVLESAGSSSREREDRSLMQLSSPELLTYQHFRGWIVCGMNYLQWIFCFIRISSVGLTAMCCCKVRRCLYPLNMQNAMCRPEQGASTSKHALPHAVRSVIGAKIVEEVRAAIDRKIGEAGLLAQGMLVPCSNIPLAPPPPSRSGVSITSEAPEPEPLQLQPARSIEPAAAGSARAAPRAAPPTQPAPPSSKQAASRAVVFDYPLRLCAFPTPGTPPQGQICFGVQEVEVAVTAALQKQERFWAGLSGKQAQHLPVAATTPSVGRSSSVSVTSEAAAIGQYPGRSLLTSFSPADSLEADELVRTQSGQTSGAQAPAQAPPLFVMYSLGGADEKTKQKYLKVEEMW
jgi:hypothetical protein